MEIPRDVTVVALMIIGLSLPAAAQEYSAADSVFSFKRAQITLRDGEKIRGDRVEIRGDQVHVYEHQTISTDVLTPRYEAVTRSMDVSQMARLEVAKSNAAKGMFIGAATGLGVSTLVVLSASKGDLSGVEAVIVPGLGAIAFTAGAFIGAITGSFFHHWETVYDTGTGWSEDPRNKYEPGVGYRRKQ